MLNAYLCYTLSAKACLDDQTQGGSMLNFRKEAIEHMQSPEELDEILKTVSRGKWGFLLAMFALAVLVVGWSFWGAVSTRVVGPGIILAHQGMVYNAVAIEKGIVQKIHVNIGDVVESGQRLVELSQFEADAQIQSLKEEVERLNLEKKRIDKVSDDVLTGAEVRASSRRLHIELILTIIEDKIAIFKKALPDQPDESKTIRLQGMSDSARSTLLTYLETYNKYQLQLTDISNQLDVSKLAWLDRIANIDNMLEIKKSELQKVRLRQLRSSNVLSPISGVVTSIETNIGELAHEGEALISIADVGDKLDVLMLVHVAAGKQIKVGMEAFVEPAGVKREEYGAIRAKVVEVNEYPSSEQSILAILQNPKLVAALMKGDNTLAVRLEILSSAKTVSGLQWTSGAGPPEKIKPGQICVAKITVRRQHPISLLIPTIKKMVGLR